MAAIPDISELRKLRVVDLKEKLSKLGLSTSGLKADLIDRLHSALIENAEEVQAADDGSMEETLDLDKQKECMEIGTKQEEYPVQEGRSHQYEQQFMWEEEVKASGSDLIHEQQMEEISRKQHQQGAEQYYQETRTRDEEMERKMQKEEMLCLQREAERVQQVEQARQLQEEELNRIQEQEEKKRQEEEMQRIQEEIERRYHEEQLQRAQEEANKRSEKEEMRRMEEIAAKRREEEEMQRIQEEAVKRRKEEEMRHLQEEAERRWQEEEQKRIQQENERKRQEELDKKRKEEEMRRIQEEAAERKRLEEQAERRRQEEEAEKRRLEEAAEKRRQEMERERKRQEAEAERKRLEEEAERLRRAEEAERRRREEEAERLRQEEEAERRQKEEEKHLEEMKRIQQEADRKRRLEEEAERNHQKEIQRLQEEAELKQREEMRRQEEESERREQKLEEAREQKQEEKRLKEDEFKRIQIEIERKRKDELKRLQENEDKQREAEERKRQEVELQKRVIQQQLLLEQQKLEESKRQKEEMFRRRQEALLAKQQEEQLHIQHQLIIQQQIMEEKQREEEELFRLQQEALIAKQKEEQERQMQQRLLEEQQRQASIVVITRPILPQQSQVMGSLTRPSVGLPPVMPQVATPIPNPGSLVLPSSQHASQMPSSIASQSINESLLVGASQEQMDIHMNETNESASVQEKSSNEGPLVPQVMVHQSLEEKQIWQEAELQQRVLQQQMLLEQQKVIEAKQKEQELFRIQQEALIAKQKEEQDRQMQQQLLLQQQQQKQLLIQQQIMEEEKRRKEEELFRLQQEALLAQQREDEERKIQHQQRIAEEQKSVMAPVISASVPTIVPILSSASVPSAPLSRIHTQPPVPNSIGNGALAGSPSAAASVASSSQPSIGLRLPGTTGTLAPSPSQATTDTSKPPPLMSLEVPKPLDDSPKEIKLPQALEKALAYKTERAQQVGVSPDEIDLSLQDAEAGQKDDQGELMDEDVDYEEAEEQLPTTNQTKQSKNKQRKLKKKRRARHRQLEQKRFQRKQQEMEDEEEKAADEVADVEVDYIQDTLNIDPLDPLYHQFMKIFETFKLSEPDRKLNPEDGKEKEIEKKEMDLRKKPKDADEEPEEEKKEEEPKLSKRKLKKLNRLSVAELKQHVARPDVVEMHDITAKDPKLLVLLKSTRNTVSVPRHWCFKRKYLQGKRGIEKPPFELPDFIKRTGIMEMRQALQEKEDQKTLKAKMREKVRPKLGKIDIDYQKLHDAFFKWQTKPRMTIHGDLYYEGKEFETRLKEKKPGELSDELRTALGMPVGPNAHKVPPPWLIAMQRYGPPPSYPNLKIPGLNAPIPDGCSFGYHAGGWGKPPVDESGKPLYGDVFGTQSQDFQTPIVEEEVDRTLWGELESESESESEEEEEEEEEEPDRTGLITPGEGGLVTPSGLTSIPAGMETPDMIELRKRKIESEMEGGETPALYTILPEKKTERIGAAMMGSTHIYDIAAAVPGVKGKFSISNQSEGGVEVALDPSELDMDTAAMAARYEQTIREQQSQLEKEDLSDMVAEHAAKQKNKRKKQQQDVGKAAKKYKEFKF